MSITSGIVNLILDWADVLTALIENLKQDSTDQAGASLGNGNIGLILDLEGIFNLSETA